MTVRQWKVLISTLSLVNCWNIWSCVLKKPPWLETQHRASVCHQEERDQRGDRWPFGKEQVLHRRVRTLLYVLIDA